MKLINRWDYFFSLRLNLLVLLIVHFFFKIGMIWTFLKRTSESEFWTFLFGLIIFNKFWTLSHEKDILIVWEKFNSSAMNHKLSLGELVTRFYRRSLGSQLKNNLVILRFYYGLKNIVGWFSFNIYPLSVQRFRLFDNFFRWRSDAFAT